MIGISTLRHQLNSRLLAAMTRVATSGVVGMVATAISRWPRCRSIATTAAFGRSIPRFMRASQQRVYRRLQQRSLIDTETVGKPVGQHFLTDRRVVVLAMLGAGFLRVEHPQRRVNAV